MIWIDIKNAFDGNSNADNFTVLLLRLIAKADRGNREKIRRGFPLEVSVVDVYQGNCPYKSGDAPREPDWEKIMEMVDIEPVFSMGGALAGGVPVVLTSQNPGSIPMVVCEFGKEAEALETMDKMGIVRVLRPEIVNQNGGVK